MEVQLLGKLNYDKLKEELKGKVDNCDEIIEIIKRQASEMRAQIVSTAGRLSRFPGNVFDVLKISENKTLEQNINFIKNVIGMGHESISDHDYIVLAIKDVSPIIEQTIIEETFSSFTIKSRREVNFSQAGFYTPDFHDKDGNILKENEKIKKEYNDYMQSLFDEYTKLIDLGITKEDARYILPYCYFSNIIMGVDAHTLKNMIVKFTKTKYSNIEELKTFGNILYNIAKENIPYIIPIIDNIQYKSYDEVDKYLESIIDDNDKNYKVLDKPKLINCSKNIDDTILISSIMKKYQISKYKASKVYKKLIENDGNFKSKLMRLIAFNDSNIELSQVNFEFQIPLSYAVLTHLTRHRTHHIMVPDFYPLPDLTQYKVPPKISKIALKEYNSIFEKNNSAYNYFKNTYAIRDEDLVYFILSGNIVNIITNIDGKSLLHILKLRECNKSQWETRQMAIGIHNEINKLKGAKTFSSVLGPTCVTQKICNEGKESCGKIATLTKKISKGDNHDK